MAPSLTATRIEHCIFGNATTGSLFVRVSVNGKQQRVSVADGDLEVARAIRDDLLSRQRGDNVDTLRLPLPQEDEPVAPLTSPEEVQPVELSPVLQAAVDALKQQLEPIAANRDELRGQLQSIENEANRLQGAIDQLEGREPDASAGYRQPGALKGNVSARTRAAFSPGNSGPKRRRQMMTREQAASVRAALLDALQPGVELGRSRSQMTEIVAPKIPDFEVTKDIVSRQLTALIEAGQAKRNDADNPKDIVYYR